MVDIHNHGLFEVDDGASSKVEAVRMLHDAAEQGITAIVLTPHYRHGMFKYQTEQVDTKFEELKKEAEVIGIELFLGCEYHVNSRILEYLQQGRCHSMADGKYVLTEYSYETEYDYIEEWTRKLLLNGYIPIIAHAERYECMLRKPERIEEIIRFGAYVQLNADSVLGKIGFKVRRFCKKIIKKYYESLIVASDSHDMEERSNHMNICYEYVMKKLGSDVAQMVFIHNPGKVTREFQS